MQWTWTWAYSGRWWGTGRRACCSPCGHKESDTTRRLNNSDGSSLMNIYIASFCSFRNVWLPATYPTLWTLENKKQIPFLTRNLVSSCSDMTLCTNTGKQFKCMGIYYTNCNLPTFMFFLPACSLCSLSSYSFHSWILKKGKVSFFLKHSACPTYVYFLFHLENVICGSWFIKCCVGFLHILRAVSLHLLIQYMLWAALCQGTRNATVNEPRSRNPFCLIGQVGEDK